MDPAHLTAVVLQKELVHVRISLEDIEQLAGIIRVTQMQVGGTARQVLAAFGAVHHVVKLCAAEAAGDGDREAQRHTGGFKDTRHQTGEVLELCTVGHIVDMQAFRRLGADQFIEREVFGELHEF